MVQPINYMLDVQNPIQTAMTGLTQGMQIGQFMQAKEQAEREAIQKQQMQQEISAFASKPNKTHDDYANIMARFPSLAEDFKRSYDVLDSGKQQATFKTTSRVYAALSGGQPSVAKSILENEALGYENAGDKATADQIRTLAGMAETDPDGLLTISGLTLASTTPSQFKDVLGALGQNQMLPEEINLKKAQADKTKAESLWYGPKAQAEIGKIKAETTGQIIENKYKPQQLQSGINQTQSQTALNYANIQNLADRLRLDQDKLQSDVELKYMELNPSNIKLSDGAQKIVNDNMVESVGLEQSANKMDDLANRFEKESQAGGLYTKGWAGFKRITGWSNDDQNAMIREYSRLRNSEAIKSLPPGPATDRDIELALRGLPPETADSTTLTSFLRGYAKLNRMDSAYKQMQAEWVNQVGNMGSNKRDVEVLGIKVPAGTTFSNYASKNLNKALSTQKVQSAQRQISTGTASYLSAVQ